MKLTITKGIITDCSCNCPFDIGPVCKHVAAVIFIFSRMCWI
ncbi:MAG: SWIM zinc finger family protein [Ignavibacteria bacterium]|nr:SWIM zinc finger family protein [Ignavibacteria bacterium]